MASNKAMMVSKINWPKPAELTLKLECAALSFSGQITIAASDNFLHVSKKAKEVIGIPLHQALSFVDAQGKPFIPVLANLTAQNIVSVQLHAQETQDEASDKKKPKDKLAADMKHLGLAATPASGNADLPLYISPALLFEDGPFDDDANLDTVDEAKTILANLEGSKKVDLRALDNKELLKIIEASWGAHAKYVLPKEPIFLRPLKNGVTAANHRAALGDPEPGFAPWDPEWDTEEGERSRKDLAKSIRESGDTSKLPKWREPIIVPGPDPEWNFQDPVGWGHEFAIALASLAQVTYGQLDLVQPRLVKEFKERCRTVKSSRKELLKKDIVAVLKAAIKEAEEKASGETSGEEEGVEEENEEL